MKKKRFIALLCVGALALGMGPDVRKEWMYIFWTQ